MRLIIINYSRLAVEVKVDLHEIVLLIILVKIRKRVVFDVQVTV